MKPTQKKGETDQQTESLQLSENRKLTPKKRGNGPKKTENKSNVNIAETNPKYSEIPLHFVVIWDHNRHAYLNHYLDEISLQLI